MNKAESALLTIPTPAARQEWLKITMAYKAAGGDFSIWDEWSKQAETYNAKNNYITWKSITEGKITAATLYKVARANGWQPPQDEYYRPQRTTARHDQPKPQAPAVVVTPGQKKKISEYIADAFTHRGDITGYCTGRGLSTEIIDRFKLGYDPATQRLIIPYPGAEYYIARDMAIAPNETDKDKKGNKYIYPSKQEAGERPLFNVPALTSGAETVFITEGQIDCITIEQYGGAGIASNTDSIILQSLKAAGNDLTAKQFLIIPDNDEAGAGIAQQIYKVLTAAGYEAYIYPLPADYHDVNNMATNNSNAFKDWVKQGGGFIIEQKRQALEQYKKTTAAELLADLDETIKRNASQEAIKTGYPTLDNVLGDKGYPGGLYPGLYFIGAVSSLGKTTFALQMADQIAAAGQDVLIFSLEMSAVELMAKSISRLTYHTATEECEKKTTRGILAGARYPHYSGGEIETINKAKASYKNIAEHLYITEAIGNIGVKDVRAAVKRHFDITGNCPVVFIDYLQILAPEDTKATEKQNTDRAVVELKRISRDFDIPVIVISSFNRENYSNEVSESAFKESGAIEYSSDVLIGLQFKGAGAKDFKIKTAKAQVPREIELFILKNRNGAIPKTPVEFAFHPLFNYFEDINNGAIIPTKYSPQVDIRI